MVADARETSAEGLREWEADLSRLPSLIERCRVEIAALDPKASPDLRAERLCVLGHALQRLGARHGNRRLLREAIAAYRKALKRRTPRRSLTLWASTMLNLATALSSLGDLERGPETLEAAAAAFRAALTAHTVKSNPAEWGLIQNNLGNVLFRLGERTDDLTLLDAAIRAYQASLKGRRRRTLPFEWAMTKNNLATAQQRLGERTGDIDLLETSLVKYRSALRVFTRRAAPAGWAMVQGNLGAVLDELGRREPGSDRLDAAARAYRAAMKVQTKRDAPMAWAGHQHNLATLLREIADRKESPSLLAEAVQAYRCALDVWRRERSPLDWALAMTGLGDALVARGAMTGDLETLAHGVATYREAGDERTRERFPSRWAALQHKLGAAHIMMGAWTGDVSEFERAAAAFGSALEERSLASNPSDWAASEAALGDALLAQAEWTADAGLAARAVVHLRRALEVIDPRSSPLPWARAKTGVADALFLQGELEPAWPPLDAAEVEYAEALDALPTGADALRADIEIKQGELLYTFGRFDEAASWFDHALNLRAQLMQDSTAPDIHALVRRTGDLGSRLAYCRWKQGEAAHGLLDFERAQAVALSRAMRGHDAATPASGGDQRAAVEEDLSLDQVLSAVPVDGVLVVPILSRAGGIAYVIPHGLRSIGAAEVVELPEARLELLASWLAGWTRALSDLGAHVAAREPRPWQAFEAVLEELLETLWTAIMGPIHARVREVVAADTSRDREMVVIAAGELALLPLHAARDSATGRAVIDDYTVSFSPSVRARRAADRRAARRAQASRRLLAAFDPEADQASRALPLSATLEFSRLKAIFGESMTALVGPAATVEAIRSGASMCDYLHFSCHGEFDRARPDRSGLVLAGGERLTMPIIARDLELSHCRVVSMAACDTAVVAGGRVSSEQVGLPAAFLQAGAPAVWATLWPVADRSTAWISARTYDLHLNHQMTPAAALRRAVLDLRDGRLTADAHDKPLTFAGVGQRSAGSRRAGETASPPDFTSAFFWAAFVFVGC